MAGEGHLDLDLLASYTTGSTNVGGRGEYPYLLFAFVSSLRK